MMLQDFGAVLLDYLRRDPQIYRLVEDRMYLWEVPAEYARVDFGPAVLLVPSGGLPIRDYTPRTRVRYDCHSYGPEFGQAGELDWRIFARLNYIRSRVETDTAIVYRVEHDGGPVSQRNENDRWPYIWRSFQVTGSPKAALAGV